MENFLSLRRLPAKIANVSLLETHPLPLPFPLTPARAIPPFQASTVAAPPRGVIFFPLSRLAFAIFLALLWVLVFVFSLGTNYGLGVSVCMYVG